MSLPLKRKKFPQKAPKLPPKNCHSWLCRTCASKATLKLSTGKRTTVHGQNERPDKLSDYHLHEEESQSAITYKRVSIK